MRALAIAAVLACIGVGGIAVHSDPVVATDGVGALWDLVTRPAAIDDHDARVSLAPGALRDARGALAPGLALAGSF